jgi:hypothetical protein
MGEKIKMGNLPRRQYRRYWQLFALLNIVGAIFIASLVCKISGINTTRDGCKVDLRGQTKFRPHPSSDSGKKVGPEIALLVSFPNRCALML